MCHLWDANWKKSYDQTRQLIKKQSHCFIYKGPSSQGYGFSSSHAWMWELDHKENGVPKNWCFCTVVLKTLESPLDSKIKPVNPQGNQAWICTGRNGAEAEALILWPPDAKSRLIGKDWCWERLRAGGEGDDRGWDGWMASQIEWTWVWVNSGSWRWTGRPGVLRSMGSQRVGHNWATELNWTMPQSLKMLKCFLVSGTAACKSSPRSSELYYSGFFPTCWVGLPAAQDLPQEKKGFFPDGFVEENNPSEDTRCSTLCHEPTPTPVPGACLTAYPLPLGKARKWAVLFSPGTRLYPTEEVCLGIMKRLRT